MKIRDIFRNPIDRRIEEVIKVDLGDEEIVAYELSEYVVTDHIRREFIVVLDAFQETINRPSEQVTAWVSGFFGSGKSSFAKVLGYLLENPTVRGKAAADRFLERAHDERLRALLATIHAQAPSYTVFVDLSSAKNLLREGEHPALPLYRALLEGLDYSRDIVLAELEYALEGDGDLEAFEEAFEKVAGERGNWRQRRNIAFARNEASHALHILRPDTYSQPDSFALSAKEPAIDADWFADRALELLARRASDARRLVFVEDEVGQYVARDVNRMFDLMGLAHAVQKKRGRVWLVVTSQEKLEDVVDALEGRRVELARVRDRFPITVDLVPSDIEEVVARRVLEKTAEGADEVRRIVRANRNRLAENVRLESPTRHREASEEELVRLYPLLPYQIQLFIDAVSAHRARGGAVPTLGGSNRTLIKLAQQFVVHQKTSLGEQEVGALVTADMGYDLLEGIIPTAWQAEIGQVAGRHDGVPTKVAKAVALLTGVPALRLQTANLAAVLHQSVDAESLRGEVERSLETLTREEVLRPTDDGYKLQSPEEKDWERERRGIDMKPAAWHRIRREVAKQLFEGLAVEVGRTFRVGVRLDGDQVVDGDLAVVIEELEGAAPDDLRARSREKKGALFWSYQPSDDMLEAARELHRSTEMLKRREGTPKSEAEVGLVGEERVRRDRAEKVLHERITSDLLVGTIFFEGVEEEPRGTDVRVALKDAFATKVETIYPRLREFTAPAKRADAVTVLRADTLDGLPTYLRSDGLGAIRATPEGTSIAFDIDPLATLLAEVRERSGYGMEATGKYLEEKFSASPFGATVEVVQVLLALLLRAGALEVVYQGARIANPRDSRLEKAFGTLPGFRGTTFAPQRDVDPDMRARVAKRLQEISGEREPLATDQLATRIRGTFRSDREVFASVIASLRALGISVSEAVERADDIVEAMETGSDEEVIKNCNEAWEDLKEGRTAARRLREALDEVTLKLLREARETARLGAEGLGPEAEERLEKLTELLRGPNLVGQLGAIRSLVAEHRSRRSNAWEATTGDLRAAVLMHVEAVRARYAGTVEESALTEALRVVQALAPAEEASPETGPSLETLRARRTALEGVVAQVESQLAAMASTAEVIRVRVRDLYEGLVTSEEDLEALLKRVRQAAEEALAQGKHFLLS